MARRAGAESPLPARPDPVEAARAVAAGIRDVLREAAVDETNVLGVGIGLPGIVEEGGTVLVHAAAIGWRGVPFADLVCAEGITLPLYLDNCAKTQGRAEMWFGAGQGHRQVVVALLGSGVGADVVVDGRYRRTSIRLCPLGPDAVAFGGATLPVAGLLAAGGDPRHNGARRRPGLLAR